MTKLVRIGKTVQGQDILAIKVTKDARDASRTAAAGGALLLQPSTPGSGSPRR